MVAIVQEQLRQFFHSLGCRSVHRRIMELACFPQNRWSSEGNITQRTLGDIGLDGLYSHLFLDGRTLEIAVQVGISSGLMNLDDSEHYSLCLEALETDSSTLEGLLFICHLFPRASTLYDS